MQPGPEILPLTAEIIRELPWEIAKPEKWAELSSFANRHNLTLASIPKALRGGGMLEIQEGTLPEDLRSFLSGGRKIAVVAAKSSEQALDSDRLIFYPPEKTQFSSNLAAYRMIEQYMVEKSGESGKTSPVPELITVEKLEDDRWVIVTEYRDNYQNLGLGDPESAIHELDIHQLPVEGIPKLLDDLEKVYIRSSEITNPDGTFTQEFSDWLNQKGYELPDSWLKPARTDDEKKTNKSCLRGKGWWINPEVGDDRLRELDRLAKGDIGNYKPEDAAKIRELYHEFFPEEDFSTYLETMIRNNLSLYPQQNGTIDDKKLVGELVVTHGTLYPGQIHQRLDPKNGEVERMITGGDRAQLFGLRGQMIDWLVSACAASPKHQKALIKAFLSKYDLGGMIDQDLRAKGLKERRGLAMHVMYRCISEIPWYVAKNKLNEARNLVRLVRDIVTGNGEFWSGAWEGVQTENTGKMVWMEIPEKPAELTLFDPDKVKEEFENTRVFSLSPGLTFKIPKVGIFSLNKPVQFDLVAGGKVGEESNYKDAAIVRLTPTDDKIEPVFKEYLHSDEKKLEQRRQPGRFLPDGGRNPEYDAAEAKMGELNPIIRDKRAELTRKILSDNPHILEALRDKGRDPDNYILNIELAVSGDFDWYYFKHPDRR